MIKKGDTWNGVVFTEEAIISLMDDFYATQKKVYCLDEGGKRVGQVQSMQYNESEGILYFNVGFNSNEKKFTEASPVIHIKTEILQMKVKE